MKKRKCKICGATLSIYNTENVCYHHTKHTRYRQLGFPSPLTIVTQCTSLFNLGRAKSIYDYSARWVE